MPSMKLPDDDPRIIAWGKFQKTEEFDNAKTWCGHLDHVDGCLWSAFIAGWNAANGTPGRL